MISGVFGLNEESRHVMRTTLTARSDFGAYEPAGKSSVVSLERRPGGLLYDVSHWEFVFTGPATISCGSGTFLMSPRMYFGAAGQVRINCMGCETN